jgi:hypothetical protein
MHFLHAPHSGLVGLQRSRAVRDIFEFVCQLVIVLPDLSEERAVGTGRQSEPILDSPQSLR